MGEDDVVVSRLLCYGSQFAHRSVLHSHQAELTGCFRREDSNYFIDGKTIYIPVLNKIFFVAGSLLLAKNGVCVIGDVKLHKKDTRESLQRGM